MNSVRPGGPAQPLTRAAGLPEGFAGDPALADDLTGRLAEVETRLVDTVRNSDVLVEEASRHLIDAGGKRIRPTLLMLAARLGDADLPEVRERLVDGAVVVELTHQATLYHDDVMDTAPVRRGVPAAQQVWGNNIAILTGDLLLSRASALAARLGSELVRIQSETFERLCMGQIHETLGPRAGEDPVEHYISVLADKTGSLIATAGRYGAMIAGAGPEAVDIMVDYGEKVGVAFQIADDVIDLRSDGAVSGKTPGTDLRDGVATMPVLLVRARAAADPADARARDTVALLDGDLSSDGSLARAVGAMRADPALEQAARIAQDWAEQAVAALDPLPEGAVKDALRSFARAVVARAA